MEKVEKWQIRDFFWRRIVQSPQKCWKFITTPDTFAGELTAFLNRVILQKKGNLFKLCAKFWKFVAM